MAIIDNPRTLDLDDIQGMVTRGYGKLMDTAYLMLKVDNAENAKSWIKKVLPQVDSADVSTPVSKTLHLAFTASGLLALGMEQDNVDRFPIPFREGIVTENRSRILGDYGDNDPDTWRWGGKDSNLHLLLILHAKDKESLDALLGEQYQWIEQSGGVSVIKDIRGYQRADGKEPFGFHDGISQPTIKGSGRPGAEGNIVEAGEFLLGHKNEHGEYPYSPLLKKEQGNIALLADDAAGSGEKDLGHNGTFLVYRQMEQYVDKFWKFMEEKTKNPDGTVNEEAKVKLASKCVGRWPSGASLVNFPDHDPGGSMANDDFGYAELDPHGDRCPIGSHLRRNNPRDAFRWYNAKQPQKVSNRHRIVRRGRIYQMPPEYGQEKGEEGLHFICFNANLELQFEFIQHAWANNNQVRFVNNDVDVIIGVPAEGNPNNAKGQFTIQGQPTNEFVENWEPFVRIRGGQYFFFPSISVLNYLTTI